jgi:tyrosyl-tRNA synthetase
VIEAGELEEGSVSLIKLLVLTGIASSNGDARRQITKDKCISVNDEKVLDAGAAYTAEQLSGDGSVLKKGKKVYHRVHL